MNIPDFFGRAALNSTMTHLQDASTHLRQFAERFVPLTDQLSLGTHLVREGYADCVALDAIARAFSSAKPSVYREFQGSVRDVALHPLVVWIHGATKHLHVPRLASVGSNEPDEYAEYPLVPTVLGNLRASLSCSVSMHTIVFIIFSSIKMRNEYDLMLHSINAFAKKLRANNRAANQDTATDELIEALDLSNEVLRESLEYAMTDLFDALYAENVIMRGRETFMLGIPANLQLHPSTQDITKPVAFVYTEVELARIQAARDAHEEELSTRKRTHLLDKLKRAKAKVEAAGIKENEM